eukprot:TRINITY_DN2487_c0_g1_i3.p1 TRINITY_DN2487_c0_g1~~TRINITY_DN2487_c0_g1_i3.p1  ORF type:complete len:146 (-),score=17.57 TRINITY_DN2487_c0_g1_i3:1578-2015(-)
MDRFRTHVLSCVSDWQVVRLVHSWSVGALGLVLKSQLPSRQATTSTATSNPQPQKAGYVRKQIRPMPPTAEDLRCIMVGTTRLQMSFLRNYSNCGQKVGNHYRFWQKMLQTVSCHARGSFCADLFSFSDCCLIMSNCLSACAPAA